MTGSKNRSIRTLHVITRLIGGGAERNTQAIIRHFNRTAGHQHDIFTGYESRHDCLIFSENTKCHVSKFLGRRINPVRDLFCLIELIRFLGKNRYDVVHTHLAKAGVLGRIAAKITGVKTVVHTFHGSTFYTGQPRLLFHCFRLVEKLLSFFTTCFIFVGRDLLDWYKEYGICNDENSIVIRSAIDVDRFMDARKQRENGLAVSFREKFQMDARHFVIATVAAFEKRKHLENVIEIAHRLKQRGRLRDEMRFVLVGRGPEEERLKGLVKKKGLEANVVFPGFHENIERLFAFFDLFLFTSGWEGLPQVFVQANIVGIPILTFEVEGAREMVKPGVNGYIFKRGDFSGIADKIAELFESRDKLGQISNRGLHIPVHEWRLDEVIRKTDRIYTSGAIC